MKSKDRKISMQILVDKTRQLVTKTAAAFSVPKRKPDFSKNLPTETIQTETADTALYIEDAPLEQQVAEAEKGLEIKQKITSVIKGVFNIATLVSNLHVKISFTAEKVNNASSKLHQSSTQAASSLEEISQSSKKISDSNSALFNSISNISDETNVIYQNTVRSANVIKTIEIENAELLAGSEDLSDSVNNLLSIFKDINDSVKSINRISDQTKILSINASIEAARAGMAGKGFAVVADEIRKLSDTTKSLTSRINELLGEIDFAAENSRENLTNTADSINRIGKNIETMYGMVTENAQAISQVNERLAGVTSTSREINDALQETTSALEVVNTDIQNVSRYADKLVKISNSLSELSTSAEEIENNMNTITDISGDVARDEDYSLSNDSFIETIECAIREHVQWLNDLKSMVKLMKVAPIQSDERKCGFGYYYYAVKPSSPKLLESWDAIEALHRDLHKKSNDVIVHIENKAGKKAIQAVGEAEGILKTIITLLEGMISITKELSDSGEKVF